MTDPDALRPTSGPTRTAASTSLTPLRPEDKPMNRDCVGCQHVAGRLTDSSPICSP
jgi:hypothetical protein